MARREKKIAAKWKNSKRLRKIYEKNERMKTRDDKGKRRPRKSKWTEDEKEEKE